MTDETTTDAGWTRDKRIEYLKRETQKIDDVGEIVHSLLRIGMLTVDEYEILLAGLHTLREPIGREMLGLIDASRAAHDRNPEGLD